MKKVESELKEWFAYIQNKYTWLTIKYEYSSWRECYLVSFSPTDKISSNGEFCQDIMDFEDRMHAKYDDFAPLFCDDESLFKLSDNAQILSSFMEKKAFTKDLYSMLSQFVLTEEEDTQNFDGETDQYSFYYDGYNKYDIAV